MLKITRTERDILEKMGYKFGKDLHKTVGSGKNKTYFITESDELIKAINSIRK